MPLSLVVEVVRNCNDVDLLLGNRMKENSGSGGEKMGGASERKEET
jgi:hypothetical protein